jgi:hypothetical protein
MTMSRTPWNSATASTLPLLRLNNQVIRIERVTSENNHGAVRVDACVHIVGGARLA